MPYRGEANGVQNGFEQWTTFRAVSVKSRYAITGRPSAPIVRALNEPSSPAVSTATVVDAEHAKFEQWATLRCFPPLSI